MALSIVSLVVAVVALVVNTSSLVRRPRIVAEWGEVADDHGGPREGLSIIVTARRRTIEVDEVGVVILPERTWRRKVPEWLHQDKPFRWPLHAGELPRRLQDGQSLRAYVDLDHAVDDLPKGGVHVRLREGSVERFTSRPTPT